MVFFVRSAAAIEAPERPICPETYARGVVDVLQGRGFQDHKAVKHEGR